MFKKAKLRTKMFGGFFCVIGLVVAVGVMAVSNMLKAGAEGFEDGTPSFGAMAALPAGFALLGDAGMDNVKRRVGQLTTMLLAELSALRHSNGGSMARILLNLASASVTPAA